VTERPLGPFAWRKDRETTSTSHLSGLGGRLDGCVVATCGRREPTSCSDDPRRRRGGDGRRVSFEGDSTYSIDAQLFSDGTATGFFDCADLAGSTFPSDISGPITSWKTVDGKITLSGTAQLRDLSGNLIASNLKYTVAIQKFGGVGKGHWTLAVPPNTPPVCSELLTSGKLVMRQQDWDEEGSS
jgi:hypothetical protein